MSDNIGYISATTPVTDWAMPLKRTGSFPLDATSTFISKQDAEAYASGSADDRGFGPLSYKGQLLSVYEA